MLLLDYTPGGPDLANQTGPLVTGSKAANGITDIGGTPLPCNETAAQQQVQPCQQHRLGDPRRGRRRLGVRRPGERRHLRRMGQRHDHHRLRRQLGVRRPRRHLHHRRRRPVLRQPRRHRRAAVRPCPRSPTGEVLNQQISTPGNAQEATINVAGALKYTALLWPYNWDPAVKGGTVPTFRNGDAVPAALRPQHHLRRLGQRRDPRRSRPVGDLRREVEAAHLPASSTTST